jgi:hypothetical protein
LVERWCAECKRPWHGRWCGLLLKRVPSHGWGNAEKENVKIRFYASDT